MELLQILRLNLVQMKMDDADFLILRRFSKAFKYSIQSVINKIWFCPPEQNVFWMPPYNTMKVLLKRDHDIRGTIYLSAAVTEEKMEKIQKGFENDLRRRYYKLIQRTSTLTTARYGRALQAQLELPQRGTPLIISISLELVTLQPQSHPRQILLRDKAKEMSLTLFSKTGSLVLVAVRRLKLYAGVEGLPVSVMARMVTIHDQKKDKNHDTLMAEVLEFLFMMNNDTVILDPVTGENLLILSEVERDRLRATAEVVSTNPATLLLHPDEFAPLLARHMAAQ